MLHVYFWTKISTLPAENGPILLNVEITVDKIFPDILKKMKIEKYIFIREHGFRP